MHLLHGVLDAGHGGDGEAVLFVAEHRFHGGLDAACGGLAVHAVGEVDGEAGHVACVVHLQRRGVGNEDVGAAGHQAGHAGIAVLAEQPRHQEGDAVDVQALTDGIHAVEEALHHVGADPADEGHLVFVDDVQRAAALEQRIVGAEVVGVLAGHGDVRLVAAAPGDARAEGDAGGQAVHLVHGGKLGQIVGGHTGLQIAARDADHQRARAHGAEGRGQGAGHAGDGGDQRDDRRHADQDAQHRQERAHAVGADVAQGHGDALPDHHEAPADRTKHLWCHPPPSAPRR